MTETQMEAKVEAAAAPHEAKTVLFYVIAVVLGVLCGILHIMLEDPLLTPLGVLASTMLLGTLRPDRPWRWLILVGVPLPIVTAIAVWTGFVKSWDRALIAGALLGILTGCAGAVGGAMMRRAFENVFRAKP